MKLRILSLRSLHRVWTPAVLAAVAVALACSMTPASVQASASDQIQLAARGDIPGIDDRRGKTTRAPRENIRAVQRALRTIGLYSGPVDGVWGPATRAAIRAYQKKSNLRPDGLITTRLLKQLETGAKVDGLLRKLHDTRRKEVDDARKALLDNPLTQGLVLNHSDEDVANAARNVTPCFDNPSSKCLLKEALESGKAIAKDELRDWAFGDILVAQVMAGHTADAMSTVRRIGDPRLIMVALRDIADAQAKAGRHKEAMESAEIIPSALKRMEALSLIANIQNRQGNAKEANRTVKRLVAELSKFENSQKEISLMAKTAVLMARSGNTKGANALLGKVEKLAVENVGPDVRDPALRHLASAFAQMDMPGKAMNILKKVHNPSDRTPVLVATATVFAKVGDPVRALQTAEAIDAYRYRAVVFSSIATYQMKNGDADGARATLERALGMIDEIKFPYARSFAASRIALSQMALGRYKGAGAFERAVETAVMIEDDALRAHTLWTISAERRRTGDVPGAGMTEQLALNATDKIKSYLSRVWMYGDIASQHAETHETKAAWGAFRNGMDVARDIHNAWGRSRALSRMAATLIRIERAGRPPAP